jgi:hypothetical protein
MSMPPEPVPLVASGGFLLGVRTAFTSVFGFVIVLLNFLPINYFVTTSHTF